MDFKGKRVLILGGTGLVGRAIAERALRLESPQVSILGLYEHEVVETLELLGRGRFRKESLDGVPCYRRGRLWGFWGNMFVRTRFKDMGRAELLSDEGARRRLIEDTYFMLSDDVLRSSYLYHLLVGLKPHLVYDSVNTATALAYQNVYEAALDLYEKLRKGGNVSLESEKMLLTAYVPQLVRHMQILRRGLKDAGARMYMKIGTMGTGGMGWDIPYTHSEDRPSRVLLSKTAMAGAQSLLMVVMSRAADAPGVKELKPAAAIAWQGIGKGDILRHGRPIPVYDNEEPVELAGSLADTLAKARPRETGENLRSVYIDTGENGMFSLGEFTTLTALGQMESITPEEIADYAILETLGHDTGRDVVDAIEASVMGPTYRAGILRDAALARLETLERKGADFPSVAFEILGPPRLSKLLYEAYILKQAFGDMRKVVASDPQEISGAMARVIKENERLRQACLSVGVPIMLPDGKLLVGKSVAIPPDREKGLALTPENIERWAYAGWVDTRPDNARAWKERFIRIIKDAESRSRRLRARLAGSSGEDRRFLKPGTLGVDYKINPGEIIAWVFINEDKGTRTRR